MDGFPIRSAHFVGLSVHLHDVSFALLTFRRLPFFLAALCVLGINGNYYQRLCNPWKLSFITF
jgi:hypothetical protein